MSVIKQLRIWFDLMWYLKNVFGKMRVTADQVFLSSGLALTGVTLSSCTSITMFYFFSDRVISVRSNVPVSIAD